MILKYLTRICCYASKEVPMKRLSLLLGLTLILGNLLNALAAFCLIYFRIVISKITFVLFLLMINFVLYLLLRWWLSDGLFNQILEERKAISNKQNLRYQFLLLLLIVVAIIAILAGVVLGFELR